MRSTFVCLHRWAGLFIALFVFVSGVTGALIAWDQEIDAWLNPHLYEAQVGTARAATGDTAAAALALAKRLEADDPRVRVKYLPLSIAAGRTLGLSVTPKTDPSAGRPYRLGFNQVAMDPGTGRVQATRQWGELAFTRAAFVPIVYQLHYTMYLPDVRGVPLGTWFMGFVSIVWTLDCLVALWISFPSRRSWAKSFAFRWRDRARLVFDLHRSGAVWTWGLLLVLAFTSVSMNLRDIVVVPLARLVSTVQPGQYDGRARVSPRVPFEPAFTREQILEQARSEAARRHWPEPAGAVHYSAPYNVYGVGFFEPGEDKGKGLGNKWLYYDGTTGLATSEKVPGAGSTGDRFMALQFPLHSGRIAGVPGRILVSLLGLAVAAFSLTGVLLWTRRRRARMLVARRNA